MSLKRRRRGVSVPPSPTRRSSSHDKAVVCLLLGGVCFLKGVCFGSVVGARYVVRCLPLRRWGVDVFRRAYSHAVVTAVGISFSVAVDAAAVAVVLVVGVVVLLVLVMYQCLVPDPCLDRRKWLGYLRVLAFRS